MQTTGNGVDFGDMTDALGNGGNGACGSPTRGIFVASYTYSPGTYVNTVEYITIATLGNSQDFGDITRINGYSATTSSSIRAINAGGYSPGYVNTIDYCTIATKGNFTDFGDRTVAGSYCSGTSNGHGGLG